jgi:hypothetical protein
MQKFATTAPITAVLDVPAGRVQFIAADRTDATVEVRPANPNKNRDVKTAEQTTATFTDGILHITAATPGSQLLGPGSLEVTVQLPSGSHVQATTATTELRAVGRLGQVTYTGAYRTIKIDEAAQLNLVAVDGPVHIGRLTGPAQITTARGDITINEADHGTLELRTSHGDITVNTAPHASAALNANTPHGRIDNALKNNGTTTLHIHATTTNGNITAHTL